MKQHSGDETELLLLPQLGAEKIPNYKQVVQVTLYHFYITGVIEEPEKYLDLIHTLKTVEEHDTIFLYINCVGGNLYTTIQIINAMQNCNGTVITCLEGEACSAATVIFLAGHKHIINDFGAFMVHKYSHGVAGKGSDVASQVKFSERYFDDVAYTIYKDLMTTEEITQMLKGEDFWFTSKEVLERLSNSGREVLGSETDAIPQVLKGSVEEVVEDSEELPIPPRKSKVKAARRKRVTTNIKVDIAY